MLAAWRSLATCRRRAKRRFSRAVASRSMRRPSQSACGSSAASGLLSIATSASAMADRPSARRRSTVGWISMGLFSSVVVAGTTDVGVDQDRRWVRRAGHSRHGSVLQNGRDRGVGPGVERERPRAGRIDPLGPVALDQADDADGRAEALFGMRPRTQDQIDEPGSVGADLGRLAPHALMRPVAVAPMRAGHVLRHGGGPVRTGRAQVRGDAFAAMEDLDGGGGDPGLDLLARQGMRNAVVVLGDLDMVVEPHPAALPLGVLVGLGRQGREGRAFDLLKELASRATPAAQGAIVEVIEERTDRLVEGGEREETAIAQARQDPAPDDLHADLDLGFVARLVGARRDDGGSVVAGGGGGGGGYPPVHGGRPWGPPPLVFACPPGGAAAPANGGGPRRGARLP